jgi:beta-glucosidase
MSVCNAYAKEYGAEELVANMSLEDKIHIVVGPGMSIPSANIHADPINLITDVQGVAGYINGVEALDIDGDTVSIPAVKLADGPAGLRIDPTRDDNEDTGGTYYYTTAFPIATMLASTWNVALAVEMGAAVGQEVKEYGVDLWLAPALNIQRNPLCGRNFEYLSEDPLVSGVITSGLVKGVESQGVGTTIKHFVANNSETNRLSIDTIVTERALREIYLRGFQIVVEQAQPWALMTACNKVNGVYTSQSKDLITHILREEWGFKGLVMTDWTAGDDPVAQMIAGNDLLMPGDGLDEPDPLSAELYEALEDGILDESIIDRNAVHIMNQVIKMPTYRGYDYSDAPDLSAHAAIAGKVAAEGMVLLENNGALPFSTSAKVASFGVGQILTIKGGTGSGDVHPAYTTTIAQGLDETFTIDQDLVSHFEAHVEENSYEIPVFWGTVTTCDENPMTLEEVEPYASANDVAVITISRISGENLDRTNTQRDFLLTDEEMTLLDNVSSAFHEEGKKVVVVLNVGGPIEMASWKDQVDAVLLAWQPGQEAGTAIAQVLSGVVNPSGKLAQTFPVVYEDNPSSSTFPGTDLDEDGNPTKIYYNDDIYVGYRYYSTFDVEPLYEFGYGLSYTQFEYADARITDRRWANKNKPSEDFIEFAVDVTNVGTVPGREVVQVYVSAPEKILPKPDIELKAFAKTRLLQPQQSPDLDKWESDSQTLTFGLNLKTLASFDTENDQWIVEPGLYKVYVSPSSDVSKVKPLRFRIFRKIVVADTTPDALAPVEDIDDIIEK